jgi:hypothetical protein
MNEFQQVEELERIANEMGDGEYTVIFKNNRYKITAGIPWLDEAGQYWVDQLPEYESLDTAITKIIENAN